MQNKQLIDLLHTQQSLGREQWVQLIATHTPEESAYAGAIAAAIAKQQFGGAVYTRGLIEFSNYCKNDCLYCGIRRSNKEAARYRLTTEEILECCKAGHALGFRTFVLQGGEDPFYTPEKIAAIVRAIKSAYPECALTLSLGEHGPEAYQLWFGAGADRYLLRHETACPTHYAKLHPPGMALERRKQCLFDLKQIGYQVGCGFMVGSPGQTAETLAEDFLFIHGLSPHMVGIGPFIPHHATPFRGEPRGSLSLTLFLLSLMRIMLPPVLLPATTALGTIHPLGREKGIQAGANVVMPNLSPTTVRAKYLLYDDKICTGDEAAECRSCLSRRMQSIGHHLTTHRGDWRPAIQEEDTHAL